MKILQINTTFQGGSHGRIAGEIDRQLRSEGHESYVVFGRGKEMDPDAHFKMGTRADFLFHVAVSRISDRHGSASTLSTSKLLDRVREIQPDLIHLHNLHGYYLNAYKLFQFIQEHHIPVVWTLHDCWGFTGHCSYFDAVGCEKWKTECHRCPNLRGYPTSWIIDNSRKNFRKKRELLSRMDHMVVVSPSAWLNRHLGHSFLRHHPSRIIPNGVDTELFHDSREQHLPPEILTKLEGKKIILGVANRWDRRKGLGDFLELRKQLNNELEIVLVGLSPRQSRNLPVGITGIQRMNNIRELASIYAHADVFVNPTYVDNFPTTNLEALACGTPVVTYDTGGSPEAIDDGTGITVDRGDIESLRKGIGQVIEMKHDIRSRCRSRATRLFNSKDRILEYFRLYAELLGSKRV